ncbi:MarR family transcriptional regulator|uniref:Transcriptional regulator, MarR family n=1 Tax=Dendrosporobacter quercicolus TaxID=146817 RepID=A0A1G9NBU7_9FIRM|nr:MarR family transcriptional regulator [Dendrosporobacter quercicolus]NSL47291.1 MarR family transcriptional regulator [Dendrosporobacter quercicolus DSM 1736]SDL84016.1 transcriptional regulator, MarR family [Dendrosporobacter quercicolus]
METLDELTHELFSFFNGFSSWESSVIRSSDLTVAEAHAIEILGTYGQMNMRSLAQKSGVTTGTTTVTVDRLEKKAYATREPVKEDRRVFLITLTEKGRQAFEEHHQYHTKLTEQVMTALSEEESEQLVKLLKKINAEAF